MKRIYLLFFIAAFYFNAEAQIKMQERLPYLSPHAAWFETEMISQMWDNGAWLNMAKTNFFYNSNGLVSNDMNYSWGIDAWQDNSRSSYAYNANGRLETALTEDWDGSAWIEKSRMTNTYNDQGKILTMLSETNNAGVWENATLSTNTYSGNNLTELLMQNWDSGAWVTWMKSIYEHNEQGLVTTTTSQMWLFTTWMSTSKSINTYNANNLLAIALRQSWNGIAWTDNGRSTYSYNAGNKPETVLGEKYLNGTWENDSQIIYSYDENGNNTEILYQNWVNGAWENSMRMTISYETATAVEASELIAPDFKLFNNYPNPFNPSTTIKFSIPFSGMVTLKIFNTIGQEIATLVNQDLNAGIHKISWTPGNLPSGIYLCRLQSGNHSQVRKLQLLK